MGADLSGAVVVAIVLISLAAFALDVFCIVDIVRRPAVLGGQKWVWILVVLLFDVLGPLVYLALGRTPAPAAEAEWESGEVAPDAEAAAESPYGPTAGPAPAQPAQPPAGIPAGPAAPDAPEPPAAPAAPE